MCPGPSLHPLVEKATTYLFQALRQGHPRREGIAHRPQGRRQCPGACQDLDGRDPGQQRLDRRLPWRRSSGRKTRGPNFRKFKVEYTPQTAKGAAGHGVRVQGGHPGNEEASIPADIIQAWRRARDLCLHIRCGAKSFESLRRGGDRSCLLRPRKTGLSPPPMLAFRSAHTARCEEENRSARRVRRTGDCRPPRSGRFSISKALRAARWQGATRRPCSTPSRSNPPRAPDQPCQRPVLHPELRLSRHCPPLDRPKSRSTISRTRSRRSWMTYEPRLRPRNHPARRASPSP